MAEELKGKIQSVRFYAEDTGFLIGATNKGDTIKGTIPNYSQGIEYTFKGKWITHPKYGRQFQFSEYESDVPVGGEAFVEYLCDIAKWVGPTRARLIVEEFGEDSLRVCKEEPWVVTDRIHGITEARSKDIAMSLKAAEKFEQARLRLKDILKGTGVGKWTVDKIIGKWGAGAADKLQQNPYLLIEDIKGVGFLTADKIARAVGFAKDGVSRIRAGIVHVLREAGQRDGHVCIPHDDLEVRATKLLAIDIVKVHNMMWNMIGEETLVEHGGGIYLKGSASDEDLIARGLSALLKAPVDIPETDVETLADDQIEAVRGALAAPVSILTGAPGTGKAQPLNAKILTPSGWQTMGETKVGDLLSHPSGGTTKVVGIYPQGEKEVFRVLFSDKSHVECCREHLWLTTMRNQRKKRGRVKPYHVHTLESIIGSLKTEDGTSNHSIPIVRPLEFIEKKPLSLDPYLLGLLIGDGCFADCYIGWSNPEKDLANAVKTLLPKNVAMTKDSDIDYRLTKDGPGRTNALYQIIKKIGLWGKRSHQKYIPKEYLFSSIESRIAILQGLMDTDGYCGGRDIEFSTSSPQLADDFKFIVQSLGGTARIVVRSPKFTYKGESKFGRLSYRMHPCLPPKIEPFRSLRKKSSYIPRSKYLPRRVIRDIEYTGIKHVQCIQVSAEDGQYITDDCVVTHNTYTVQKIISGYDPRDVVLVAPTGKAAKRMFEMTGHEASTIHRLLKPDPKFGWEFTVNAENPIEARLVVVDETSMVDNWLMARLVDALKPGTRLVLVGDTNQLPSVGAGNVLADLIGSGRVPSAELTEIKRQDPGLIILNCHAIKDGRPPVGGTKDNGDDFFIVSKPTPDKAADAVLEMVTVAIPRFFKEVHNEEIDASRDIQVITALRERTLLSCKNLNDRLRAVLNPAPPGTEIRGKKGAPLYRVGDKVIQVKNDYVNELMNGDIGFVTGIAPDGKEIEVQFEDPRRDVVLPKFGNDLDLAYALTVHKFQGSEAKAIVVPVHRCLGAMMLQRPWIYTAVSRAQRLCVLIGQKSEIAKSVERINHERRFTGLAGRMKA